MNKKKNILSLFLAVFLAVSVLGGCGKSDDKADTPADTSANAAAEQPGDAAAQGDTADTSAEQQSDGPVLVYDAAEDMLGYADPDNLPGCLYPSNEGEISANGSGRLVNAGDIRAIYEEGKGIKITQRVNGWDSLDVTLGDLEPDNYTLEVTFAASESMTFSIEYADVPWSALIDDDGTNVTLTFDFMLDEKGIWNDPAGVQNRFRMNAKPLEDYYIESIRIYANGGDVEGASKPVADLSLPSLAETYKDYFLIGGIFSARELDTEERFKMLKHHYNVLTADNAMKPDAMQNKDGFTFDSVDRMLGILQDEGFLIVGHTLAWHNQSPAFLNKDDDGNPLPRAEAEANLKAHIDGVAGHYAGKILAWDVLNEAIDDGKSADWKEAIRRNDWYNAFANGGDGHDYVEFAFRAAREADPNAILYYNDYNLDYENKALAVAGMVREINDKYKAEGNTRLLIEGIGMQGHYNAQTKASNVERSLQLFIDLGVEISVTELDITVPAGGSELSGIFEHGQAVQYAELFALYKKYSDYIARVTFWGLDDATSWRATQFPLIFNRDFSPKLAYYAVLEPEKFLAENTTETVAVKRSGTAMYGAPAIDAVNLDAAWETAEALPIDIMLQAWQTATGTAKVMWDESNLYLLFEVNDPELDASGAGAHEDDSIEAFVDWTNCKAGSFAACDGQYRISFENKQGFNPPRRNSGIESAAHVEGAKYRIVLKLPAADTGGGTPEEGMVIGFDAQINDAKDGSRVGVAKWNDASDDSWQNTSNWGTLTLVKP